MSIISIQRDQNNNISIVRMQVSDTLAEVSATDYILNNQEAINTLNGGTWGWFITDMILVAAEDGNAFYEFVDTTFATIVIFGDIASGQITPGLKYQLPYYSQNGQVLSPLTNAANSILATSGSSVPGLTQTLPTAVQGNISQVGTVSIGTWNATPVTVPFGGTGNTTFTAYTLICAGTTATGTFQNVSGVGTSGQILTSNGAGMLPTWQTNAASGTVNPGTINEIAYYAANGSAVSGISTANSSVFITSGMGVPSWSTTLPNGLAMGTPASLTLTNATGLLVAGGGTGNTTFTAYSVICAGTTATGAFQNVSGVGTSGYVLTSNGAGMLPTWQEPPGGIPAALTKTDDTNVTLTLGGTPATALLQATSLTLGWTGTLSGTRGGTGVNNGASTITLGGSLTTSGAFASTFTMTNTTSVTFPTSGTLATTSQIPTGAALTKTDDTNVTLTLGGSPATALVNAASITAGWTGQLSLARGGTNANLTASNGGIFYSTASAGAILAGTATANQVLLSGSSTTPAWSTATYPSTTTINQLLYSSAANTIVGLATANSSVLITSAGGVPSLSTTLPSGISASGMILTSPKIITSILDTNGNVIVGIIPTASSVNYVTIENNVTTGQAQVGAAGSDTNVGLGLIGQGTGGARVQGTGTNDNAPTGFVGEEISSTVASGSPVGFSNATAKDLTSISLTAGDWNIYANIFFSFSGLSTGSYVWISKTSATQPDLSLINGNSYTSTSSVNAGYPAPFFRAALTTTTTIYLSGIVAFSTGACSASGGIYARRAR